jgi:ribose transport system substrate-binding protein
MSLAKRTTVAAVVALLTLSATACGSGGGSGKSGEKQIDLGLSVSTLNNPFFVQLKKGAEAEAKREHVHLTVTDARNDASAQADQLQNFASQNMDAVIVNAVDSKAAAAPVKGVLNAGIPVLAADRSVDGADVVGTVASDNVHGGELAAKTLADQLGGKGTIVVLQGQTGTSAARERGKGFRQGLKTYPGIKVVAKQPADFDRAKGLDVMTNLLQSHPHVDGVFAQNDEMALGAVKALGSRAGSTVKVVGFDGTPDGLKAVKAGKLTASVAQQPEKLGEMAVHNAVRAVNKSEVDKRVKVPVKVVTKDNVADFLK